MRVMLVGFDNDFDTVSISKKISKEFRKYIYIDSYNDVGEAEYMACIRSYDLIFIKNIPENYMEYLNFFKELKNQQFLKIKFFKRKYGNDNKKISEKSFYENIRKIFSELDITFLEEDMNEDFNYLDNISQSIETSFTKSPETIKNLEIDYINQNITIFTNEKDSFNINIPKEKDFKILVYFIRHYGEVISVDSILSGISEEPESILTSPIETGISAIRKIFKTKTPVNIPNPIKATKRIGYSFQLVV